MSGLLSRTAVLTVSRVSNFAIHLFSPLLLVRILDVAGFGQYQEFMIYAALLVVLCAFAVDSSLTYFLPRFPERERSFVTQTTIVTLAVSSICLAILWLAKPLALQLATYDFVAPLAVYVFFFVIPVMVAVWWTATGPRRTLALISIGLALMSILLSASRGAMVGLVVGAIISAVYLRRYISAAIVARTTLTLLLFTTVTVLLVLSTDFEHLLKERFSTGLDTGSAETISSGRTRFWLEALRDMTEYPLSFLVGLGWEAYYQTAGHRVATHNVYLDRLYNLGIIGLALFALIYVGAIATLRRGLTNATLETSPYLIAAIIGIASFTIAMAFTDIELAATYVWAYAGLALRIAVSASDTQRNDRRAKRDQT